MNILMALGGGAQAYSEARRTRITQIESEPVKTEEYKNISRDMGGVIFWIMGVVMCFIVPPIGILLLILACLGGDN